MRAHRVRDTRYDGAPLPWAEPAGPRTGEAGPDRGAGRPERPELPPTPQPVLPWLPGAPPSAPGRPAVAQTDPRPAARFWSRVLPQLDRPRPRLHRARLDRPRPDRARPDRPRLDARQVLDRLGVRGLVAVLAVTALVLAAVVVAVVAAVARRGDEPTVVTPFLSYAAPAGWAADPAHTAAPLDAPALSGTVHAAGYDCGGQSYVRGFAAAALLPADASAGSKPSDRAERLARWFATASYATAGGVAPAVTVAAPRPVRVAGPDGPVDATVTEVTARAAADGTCAPSGGTVLALAAPAGGGAALLLVAGDTGGGPAEPAPPDRATLDAVLASVRLGPG